LSISLQPSTRPPAIQHLHQAAPSSSNVAESSQRFSHSWSSSLGRGNLQQIAMVWTMPTKLDRTIESIVNRVMTSHEISRQEHLQLTSAMLASQHITDDERRLINRVFDHVRMGELKLIE
jgi:hypothetical protein